MDDPGELAQQDGFEMREGIEMVPGTVHLVDSEFAAFEDVLRIFRQLCSAAPPLFNTNFPQCREPPASSIELAATQMWY